MVEVKDFLAEIKVFEERWAARAVFEGVLVVFYRFTLRRGKDRRLACCGLMQLTPAPRVSR